jgi:hypothetical protein
LLCDTDVAKEALPAVKLPRQRFRHPEDAEHQIVTAQQRYLSLFGRNMQGMWPSEGSVSEETLDLMLKCGITWTATDEEILNYSLAKSNLNLSDYSQHRVHDYGPGLKLFFRDHRLSDRIGFVYSGWKAEDAVRDLADHLLRLRDMLQGSLDQNVVSIILDGENAWEYFPNDGREFLEEFYRTLNEHPLIETVTMSEAAGVLPSRELPSVFAGSWINHSFRIWIGHEEDNTAWDLLKRARDALVEFERENPDFDAEKRAFAWDRIYIAEGSDWCWWYGDEHRGAHNDQFDAIFRRHLAAVYQSLELNVPPELHKPIHSGGEVSYTIYPADILTAQIDGRITHFYEWAGAGMFDCLKVAGAMHRVDRHVAAVHFAYDHNRVYIRLDFRDRKRVVLFENLGFEFGFFTPAPIVLDLRSGERGFQGRQEGRYEFAMDEILELAVERSYLLPLGYGKLGLTAAIFDGDNMIETWPEDEPIQFDVPEKNKEIFWPS